MKLLSFTALIILTLCLSSCQGFNILGHKVEIVNNRAPDGTFLPANQVINSAGEVPDSWANVYHYPSGNLGVSGYSGLLNGRYPSLSAK